MRHRNFGHGFPGVGLELRYIHGKGCVPHDNVGSGRGSGASCGLPGMDGGGDHFGENGFGSGPGYNNGRGSGDAALGGSGYQFPADEVAQ